MDARQRAVEAIMAKRPAYLRAATDEFAQAVESGSEREQIIAGTRLMIAIKAYLERPA